MDNPLWDFSLKVYAKPAVKGLLLHLQDDLAADCNVLLALAWLASRDRALDSEALSALLAQSALAQEQCLKPLRALRRNVKPLDASQSLYSAAKALELAAERWQQDQLLQLLSGAAQASKGVPAVELALAYSGRYGDQLGMGTLVDWSDSTDALMRAMLGA